MESAFFKGFIKTSGFSTRYILDAAKHRANTLGMKLDVDALSSLVAQGESFDRFHVNDEVNHTEEAKNHIIDYLQQWYPKYLKEE